MTFRIEDWLTVTAALGRRYATVNAYLALEAEDIEQELNLLLCEKADEFRREWDSWDSPDTVVRTFLEKRATEYVKTRRSYALVATSQYQYTPDIVRELLGTFFNRGDWESAEVPADALSLKGGDGVDMSADIARVWNGVSAKHAEVLFRVYALGEKPAYRLLLLRAVESLTDLLNSYKFEREHEGPGARTAMSNAQAREMVRG